MNSLYGKWAPKYAEKGFWPRRVWPKTKACFDNGWQQPVPTLDQDTRRPYGVALLMGSPFPDSTSLGALDIDCDQHIGLGRALLDNPPCGRIGQKGIVYFVRVRGVDKNPEFYGKGEMEHLGKVAECLFHKKLCVIPPTIHPETGEAYRWVGTPLLETNYLDLPIVEG